MKLPKQATYKHASQQRLMSSSKMAPMACVGGRLFVSRNWTCSCILGIALPNNWHFSSYLFMKVTIYMRRGVQIIGWSVRMALIACFTQYSGFKGGRKGSISFLEHLIKTDLYDT